MNLEQNDFLTAYLDDELEPEPRLRVESALGKAPGLCEGLHDLAAVRDLVSELVEPAAPVDVSVSVVAAIRRRREAGARVASWSRRGAALVSAAAALIAWTCVGVGPANPGAAPVTAVMNAVSARPDPAPVAVTVEPAPVVAAAVRTAPVVDRRRERERSQVRSLLKNPNLRKVLIVTDVIGGDADRQVGDLIKKTPRRNAPYRRFTVNQAIAFDPEHPGEVTVFAVVMDDQELGEFRASLDRSFPAAVQESDPRPELVTAMSEVGQVSVFPGTPVADVTVPVEGPNPALKAGATNLVQVPDAEGPDEAPARAVPEVASRERSGPRGKPPAPASSLVLVMVASPRPLAPRH